MFPAGNLLIPASHGRLETILKEPDVDTVRGAALVLHPHPLGGGTMHNRVVFRAASALHDAGLVTLRINFRGVGRSTGTYEEGRGEREDALVALDHLHEKYSALALTICGFSFGALVGMEVGVSDARVTNLISIGTPVDKYDFRFLSGCTKPILFVHGEHDEFGNVDKLRGMVAELAATSDAQLVVIANTGHFFQGGLNELKQAISEWIKR